MRGQRKPTALKLLHGEKNKDRINLKEPKPKRIAPKIPSHLDKIEKQIWRKDTDTLERLGLLTEIDGPPYATLCILRGMEYKLKKALDQCKDEMVSVKTSFLEKQGDEGRSDELMAVEAKVNPLVKELRMLSAALRPYYAEFAMGPASRSKVTASGGEEEDEFFGG